MKGCDQRSTTGWPCKIQLNNIDNEGKFIWKKENRGREIKHCLQQGCPTQISWRDQNSYLANPRAQTHSKGLFIKEILKKLNAQNFGLSGPH